MLESLSNLEKFYFIFRGAALYLDVKDLLHSNEHVCKINNLDHLDHTVQLFFDLLKGFIIADCGDGHSGNCWVLRGSNCKTVQVIGLSGEKTGNLGKNTDLVFNVERDPSFFHSFIHHSFLLTIHDQISQGAARLDHRVNHFLRINDKFDDRRSFCILLSLFESSRNLILLSYADTLCPIALCETDEIRCVFRIFLTVCAAGECTGFRFVMA